MLPNLGFHELLIFGTIAIVLFGKRLPEVARSLGSTYRQFREGLADFQRQMDVTNTASSTTTRWAPPVREPEDRQIPTAPKFELPTAVSGPSADTTAADTTAADSTMADSTMADTTAADSTAADSTAADSTMADVSAEATSGVTSSAPELGSVSPEAASQS